MKKWSMKSVTLLVIIILLAVNSGLLFSYYNFYLSDEIMDNISVAKEENFNGLSLIKTTIEGKDLDETVDLLKLYVKNNNGFVTLKDADGNIIYTNKKDNTTLFSTSSIILINDESYELTYSKMAVIPGLKLIRNFVFYEIILVSSFLVVAFFISSKKLIDPIETITKDINNYKFGKRPFKRKMPKKMEQIQNTFVDMVDSLELEKEGQNQIIAAISHDLKTPLTSIIGYADRLQSKKLTLEKKEQYVDKIYRKSLMMKEILEEFDDYQSCNIKDTLKLKKMTIKEVCNQIRLECEDELNDKNITLKINSTCDEKVVNVDFVKMKRVFGNIINNSVTHFKGRKGLIEINISYKAPMIKVEVADNGGGVKEEKNLKRIFEPLFTTDPSRKISGLGLSICKQIISCHDGRIYAKNNSIGGLSIIFFVPVSN